MTKAHHELSKRHDCGEDAFAISQSQVHALSKSCGNAGRSKCCGHHTSLIAFSQRFPESAAEVPIYDRCDVNSLRKPCILERALSQWLTKCCGIAANSACPAEVPVYCLSEFGFEHAVRNDEQHPCPHLISYRW